jgi:hypothetical protein
VESIKNQHENAMAQVLKEKQALEAKAGKLSR